MPNLSVSRLAAMCLVALWGARAEAACPASASQVREGTTRGLDAWRRWAWDDFTGAAAEVRGELACLSEPLSTAEVADLHLLFALEAGRAQDSVAAIAAFRALLVVEPGYTPSDEDAAPGSLLRAAYDTARQAGPGPSAPLSGGGWWVDGAAATTAPTQRASLVQRSADPPVSRYLDGRQSAADLAALSGPVEASVGGESPKRGRPSLFLAAGGAAAAAGAAVVFLVPARSTFNQYTSAPQSELDRLESLNHASIIGGYALGAASVGLLAGAAIQGRW